MPVINIQKRSPVVVVLGHVDHGKTSLLDKIRSSNVAAREAGGITQKVSTSQIVTKEGKKIVFIDTPGHAAFSLMRKRGSTIADIAILVVAADDGVQPQTAEAITHIQNSQIPYIVAINKTDLPSANPEMTLGQLAEKGVLLEKRGGNIPYVLVSAKTGSGLEELLETVILIWEMTEIPPASNLVAFVLESEKGKAGYLANVVVKSGKLMVGQIIYINKLACKIRGLIGLTGPKKEALAGEVTTVLGFEKLPKAGEMITKQPQEEKDNLEDIKKGTGFPIAVKADNTGSLEALLASIPAGFEVLDSGVGDVNESDILNAKAKNVIGVFLFNVVVPSGVKKLAESEGVSLFSYQIIYELLEKLAEIYKGGLVTVLGKAQIVSEFPFNGMRVAGCRMIMGKIAKSSLLTLIRDETELGKIKVSSLRKQKNEVGEVSNGEEFGMLFTPHLDFKVGDVILATNK